MSRKAQMSQVFTSIIVILVVGVLVVFGYKGYVSIINADCERQRAAFEKSLTTYLDEYTNKESVREETLRVPCDVKEVCFADYGYCDGSSMTSTIRANTQDPVVLSSVGDPTGCTANIFLMGEFTETLKFSKKLSERISLPAAAPYDCFKVTNGRIKVVFEGQGRKTLLSHS
jgi:hypothetical protein